MLRRLLAAFHRAESGELTSWPQTALQKMLLLNSASPGPMFRCFQIGGCSELEPKVKAVRASVGAQADVITHLDYTRQGLRPRSQEGNLEGLFGGS